MTTPAPRKVVIGNAELWLGDCRDVLPLLADESVDIILTDPPYGHNNNNGDLIANRERALGKLASIVDASAPRPISNDGMADMQAVVDAMLVQAARLLRHDSCCCCCCCGGGGLLLPGWPIAWTRLAFSFFTPWYGIRAVLAWDGDTAATTRWS